MCFQTNCFISWNKLGNEKIYMKRDKKKKIIKNLENIKIKNYLLNEVSNEKWNQFRF